LLCLTVFIAPLFLLLTGAEVVSVGVFMGTLLLGTLGISAAGTLIAALTCGAQVKSGLFSILMLPVILPVFLPAIFLTAGALGGGSAPLSYLVGMGLYDGVLLMGASVLFDYLWYED
jgi:heme exporter protein B